MRQTLSRVAAAAIVVLFTATVILQPEAWFGSSRWFGWISFAAGVVLMIAFATYAIAGDRPANRILVFLDDAYKLPGRIFERFISIDHTDVKVHLRKPRSIDVDPHAPDKELPSSSKADR